MNENFLCKFSDKVDLEYLFIILSIFAFIICVYIHFVKVIILILSFSSTKNQCNKVMINTFKNCDYPFESSCPRLILKCFHITYRLSSNYDFFEDDDYSCDTRIMMFLHVLSALTALLGGTWENTVNDLLEKHNLNEMCDLMEVGQDTIEWYSVHMDVAFEDAKIHMNAQILQTKPKDITDAELHVLNKSLWNALCHEGVWKQTDVKHLL